MDCEYLRVANARVAEAENPLAKIHSHFFGRRQERRSYGNIVIEASFFTHDRRQEVNSTEHYGYAGSRPVRTSVRTITLRPPYALAFLLFAAAVFAQQPDTSWQAFPLPESAPAPRRIRRTRLEIHNRKIHRPLRFLATQPTHRTELLRKIMRFRPGRNSRSAFWE